jgi:hypothetical protein
MVLVPGCAAVCVALFPRQEPILPLGFWILWLLLSLGIIFYAPVIVDRLTPETGRNRECAIYARWGMRLGFINLAWSAVELLFLR